MSKIDGKEYMILKNLKEDNCESIFRDKSIYGRNGELWASAGDFYKNERERRWFSFKKGVSYGVDNNLFQFIQWEDEKPYNIQELISDYEYKTGIFDWAAALQGALHGESEETEVLSPDWIDSNSVYASADGVTEEYVHVDDLQNLLVPKQEDMFNGEEPDEGEVYFAVGLEGTVEVNSASNIDEAIERLAEHETNYNILKKPVIPKFVDDYIKWYEKSFIYTFDTDAEYIISLLQVPFDFVGCERVKEWRDKSGNAQKLIDAYRWGYEVEKEQKYYARIKGWENVTTGSEAFNWVYFKEKDTVGISKAVENKYQTVSFTKYDWNNLGINDDNADFELVEELEE